MYPINKSINSPSVVYHVILVHVIFHNKLKLCDYKGNLKVECAILPLLNANVFKIFRLKNLVKVCIQRDASKA